MALLDRVGFRPVAAVLTGIGVAFGLQIISGGQGSLSHLFAGGQSAPAPPALLYSQDLVYEGAFRIPHGTPGDDQHSANFGGGCLAYYDAGNGGTGSLFVCGMDTGHLVGEISVPTPVIASSLNALPVASLVNNFVDPLQGHVTDIYGDPAASVALGGLLVANGRLIVSAYGTFDTNSSAHPNTHFLASLDLSHPVLLGGPYQVGNPAMPGFVGGSMTSIPLGFQSLLGGPFLTGQCCLNIISRTSSGPSATVFDPSDLGRTVPAPAKRVVGYPYGHATLGDWYGQGGTLYNGGSRAAGAVFPEGTRSVLFFGQLGTGPFCYGESTNDPNLIGQMFAPGVPYCYDPSQTGKGPHSYPYQFQVWAYDANDLAAVKAGKKNDYDVVPYANWSFTLPILHSVGAATAPSIAIGSVAYDPATQRIFVAQKNIDAAAGTIINVFHVQTGLLGLCR